MEAPLKIVVVEDDPDIRDIVEMALSLDGMIKILAFATGAAAIAAIGTLGSPIDLFLLDLHLPDMDGAELWQQLRGLPEFTGVPAVFLTASVRTQDIERFEGIGAIGTIAKPFDPLALARKVRGILAKWKAGPPPMA